jgi:ABC-type molybdate transport system substrate-binding protein
MIKRAFLSLITLLAVISAPLIYPDDNTGQATGDINDFITIILHGADQLPANSNEDYNFYNPNEFYIGLERSANGIYNIMHYRSSNMSNYDSSHYVQEIGDFNNGFDYAASNAPDANGTYSIDYTPRLRIPQPFIGLAKCEWVYRHSFALRELVGSLKNSESGYSSLILAGELDHWWTTNNGMPIMEMLLRYNIRFSDFFLLNNATGDQRFNYIKNKIPEKIEAIIPVSDSNPNEYTITILLDSTTRTKLAKEFYQLATGNYFDPVLRERAGNIPCPNVNWAVGVWTPTSLINFLSNEGPRGKPRGPSSGLSAIPWAV